tara:strand:+ start:30 stop:203 length:174 start_codon:yes stop_codon:yes gene_type:complete
MKSKEMSIKSLLLSLSSKKSLSPLCCMKLGTKETNRVKMELLLFSQEKKLPQKNSNY